MRASAKRFMAILLSCLLVLGCATGCGTSATQDASSSATTDAWSTEPVGSPWKDWFVKGVLTDAEQIRPQDDFFTAANRDYILKANGDPYTSASAADDRSREIDLQMASLIEDRTQSSDENEKDLQNLRSLYDLYQDWGGRDKDGLSAIEPIYQRLRSIKTLDELSDYICSDDHRLAMQWTAESLEAGGGNAQFVLSLYNAVNDETGEMGDGYVAEVCVPALALAPVMYENEDLQDSTSLEDYRSASSMVEYACYMLGRLGMSDSDIERVVSEAIELEDLICEGLSDGYDNYDELTFEQLVAMSKNGFPLDRVMQAYGYTDANTYAVSDTEWLKTLNELYTRENLDLFVSHELVTLAIANATLLDSEAYDALYVFDGSSLLDEVGYETEQEAGGDQAGDAGQAGDTDSWSIATDAEQERIDAVETVADALPTSFAKLYVEKFYDESLSAEAESLVRKVVDQYEKMLADEDWLSDETKQAAIDKLQAIRVYVGHPSKWADTSNVEVTSRKNGGTLLGEVRKLNALELKQQIEELRHPSNEPYWGDCMDVNAYYSPATNSITIGAGILGGVYWPKGATEEQILAWMGTTIGHEIGHAFDDQGAMFDKNGGYSNWWSDKDLEAFNKRVQRVKDAYAAVDPLGEGNYDGEQVCSEAIADLGGMKVIMQMAAEDPDFDYKRFFEAYAASWASNPTMDDAYAYFVGDSHPLDRDRVNMVVREVDEFAKVYGVKPGDGMFLNEKDRVSVW